MGEKTVKTVQAGQLRNFCIVFLKKWEEEKENVRISGKATYDLIRFKKKMEDQVSALDESFLQVCKTHNGVINENGTITIPEETREACNKDLDEISREDIEIEYTPIKLKPTDELGLTLLEILFDFLDLSETE